INRSFRCVPLFHSVATLPVYRRWFSNHLPLRGRHAPTDSCRRNQSWSHDVALRFDQSWPRTHGKLSLRVGCHSHWGAVDGGRLWFSNGRLDRLRHALQPAIAPGQTDWRDLKNFERISKIQEITTAPQREIPAKHCR